MRGCRVPGLVLVMHRLHREEAAYTIDVCMCSWWESQKPTCLLNFLGVGISEWEEVSLCMSYRVKKLRLLLCSH